MSVADIRAGDATASVPGSTRRRIDAGAHLYVCGDAKRMARDVEQALTEAIARVRGIDAEAAGEELDALAAAGRYQRDVY